MHRRRIICKFVCYNNFSEEYAAESGRDLKEKFYLNMKHTFIFIYIVFFFSSFTLTSINLKRKVEMKIQPNCNYTTTFIYGV